MRLSQEFIDAALEHVSGRDWVPLIRVSHPEWRDSLNYVRSFYNLDRDGEVYQAAGFDIAMADENDEDTPEMVWRTGAVDRELVRRLRTFRRGFLVKVTYVLSDNMEGEGFGATLRLGRWKITRTNIEGTLTVRQVLNLPASRMKFSQAAFPGMY